MLQGALARSRRPLRKYRVALVRTTSARTLSSSNRIQADFRGPVLTPGINASPSIKASVIRPHSHKACSVSSTRSEADAACRNGNTKIVGAPTAAGPSGDTYPSVPT